MKNVERESSVESYLVRRVKEEGGEVRKVRWIGRRNAPDRFVMLNGRSMFVELKRPGEEPTAAQFREIHRLTERGVPAMWLNTKELVDHLIGSMKPQ